MFEISVHLLIFCLTREISMKVYQNEFSVKNYKFYLFLININDIKLENFVQRTLHLLAFLYKFIINDKTKQIVSIRSLFDVPSHEAKLQK